MHENLKFNLQPNILNDWQPILSSQVYGTFYMVYIQFIKHEEPTEEKNYHTYYCKYKLQNFRGAITIGFIDEPRINVLPESQYDIKDPIDYSFDIKISPFNNNCDTKILEHRLESKISIPNKIFNAEVLVADPPQFMYQKNNPDQALYLHPDQYKRDGEDYMEICYRKFGDEQWPCKDNEGFGRYPGICDMTRSITR
jgi:hypothetical protein